MPGPPMVLAVPISPCACLLLLDLQQGVHATARVARMSPEGIDSDCEVLADGDVRAARNLQVVEVASVDGAHDPRGVSVRSGVRLDNVARTFRTRLHVAVEEGDGGRESADDLPVAHDGYLDREDLALEGQVGRGSVDRRTEVRVVDLDRIGAQALRSRLRASLFV